MRRSIVENHRIIKVEMINEYEKGIPAELGKKEFTSTDFDCRCDRVECTKTLIDSDLVSGLEIICLTYPIIHVDSGFRCAAHNAEASVGGKPDSQHLLGKAADVTTPFARASDVAELAESIECFENGGIGRYPSFVHLDVRGHKARW